MKFLTALSVCLLPFAFATPISPNSDAIADPIQQRGTPTTNPSTLTRRQQVTLCSQYAYHAVNGYEILNNLWGKDSASSGSQCTYFEGTTSNGGIRWSSTWTWRGADNNVKSYVYSGRQLQKGITVERVKSMQTQMNWSYNTTNGVRANVAYDIFTAQDPNHVNSSGDYELMIWLGRLGGVWPISQSGSPIATVTISGYTFDLYFGYNGSMKVYSFVRAGNNDITNFNSDVKLFFNYLVSNQGFPASTQNLIVYQTGTEAFTGGPAKFSVSNFVANYQA
ncbi:concanavalin A-like lectin/glucanase [Westerdykella ornata]|uniref:Concanavalin A-like lectin/glucanase n=1 Tax=Westerdykella ornata TaxID=318751 RepID=A0A6A6JF69_WESOR|nr:concanavalin A-like lectin/glucanase [Westerdykella ornata]KAF2274276.1 concanavalin A-like lectin/glucanase [Westerdykella ornata]